MGRGIKSRPGAHSARNPASTVPQLWELGEVTICLSLLLCKMGGLSTCPICTSVDYRDKAQMWYIKHRLCLKLHYNYVM